MQFEHKKVIIGLPESPYLLRVNKQIGAFTIGNVEQGNVESSNTFSRGKFLEFAIAACDTSLYGKIGKGKQEQQYAFISAIVTASADSRLPRGLLIHFLTYGFESRFFTMLQAEVETFSIFAGCVPQIIRMVFDKSIATQFCSTIRPPSIFSRDATKEEIPYFEGAQLIAENHSTYLPDATAIYPINTDPVSGEVVSGLTRHRVTSSLPSSQPQLFLAE